MNDDCGGASPSFCYPLYPDTLILNIDILSLIDPITDTGRTCKLLKIEIEKPSNILGKRISWNNLKGWSPQKNLSENVSSLHIQIFIFYQEIFAY